MDPYADAFLTIDTMEEDVVVGIDRMLSRPHSLVSMMSNHVSFKDSMCVMSSLLSFRLNRFKVDHWKLDALIQVARKASKKIVEEWSS